MRENFAAFGNIIKQISKKMRINYFAPQNELENYICTCFAAVLELEKVGVNNDFFRIGGDSLAAADFIVQCNLSGLSVIDLYQYRTARKLAKYYLENYSDPDDIYENNLNALNQSQALTPEMLDMFDKRGTRPSSEWYLPFMVKCSDDVDPERLKKAVNKVFRHHSALNSVIDYTDDGSLCISYAPEQYSEIVIEYITEDTFASLLKTPVRLFDVINAPLYNAVIYQTPENTYLFLNFFHAIIDGTSIGILKDEITRCYEDDSYTLDRDCYYLYLADREIERTSDKHREVEAHYKEMLQKNILDQEIPFAVKQDNAINCGIWDVFQGVLSKNKTELAQSELSKYSENGLFMMAYLLAIASINGKNGAYLQWIYNGRDNLNVINQVGLLYRTFALAISFEDGETIGTLAENVKSQMDYAIEHPDVRMSDAVPNLLSHSCTFLYQKDIYSISKTGIFEEILDVINTPGEFYENIEFEFIDSYESDEYCCIINYRSGVYTEDTIKELFRRFDCIMGILIDSQHPEKLLIKDIFRMLCD